MCSGTLLIGDPLWGNSLAVGYILPFTNWQLNIGESLRKEAPQPVQFCYMMMAFGGGWGPVIKYKDMQSAVAFGNDLNVMPYEECAAVMIFHTHIHNGNAAQIGCDAQ